MKIISRNKKVGVEHLYYIYITMQAQPQPPSCKRCGAKEKEALSRPHGELWSIGLWWDTNASIRGPGHSGDGMG